MADLPRRLAAEALGTGLLVATVVGSGIMAERLTDDVALALLGNTLPTGAILVVLITILGPVSGAHFNPAVTLVFALRREIDARDAACLYGRADRRRHRRHAAGARDVRAADPRDIARRCAPAPVSGSPRPSRRSVWSPRSCWACARAPTRVAWLVGLYITAAYWFTASTSFANPAVAIARAFTDTFAGIRPIDLPGFIIAEIAGALLAMAIAGWLLAEPLETTE